MTKQIEQLDADRLIDPTRRILLLGSAGAVGLAGFLGGGIWSVSAEALAEDLPPNKLLGFQGIAASTADEVTIAPGYRAEVLISGRTAGGWRTGLRSAGQQQRRRSGKTVRRQ